MSNKLTLTVHLEFSGNVRKVKDKKEILNNVKEALLAYAGTHGLSPEASEYYTKCIQVSVKDTPYNIGVLTTGEEIYNNLEDNMKASKEQLENAILFFADKFGTKENYKALMKAYNGTPKIVEMIVYDMFLHGFNSYHSTDEEFEQYQIIFRFAKELHDNGWVEFETCG